MSEQQQAGARGQLRKIGGMWKPKPGAKSLGSGSISIGGLKQKFVVLPNRDKAEGSKQPDYILMAGDPPEPDAFTQRAPAAREASSEHPF